MTLGLPYVLVAPGLKPGPFCVFFPFYFPFYFIARVGVGEPPGTLYLLFYHEAVSPGLWFSFA